MSAFTTCARSAMDPQDSTKRVNYVHGLVLSADEYLQESAYLAGRSEQIARDLLGYGTAAGLTVERTTTAAGGPALVVGPGLALSPGGRPIRVPVACAVHLNEWLASQRGAFVPHLRPGADSPPNDLLTLFLALRYCACATDDVPGAGGPCRTEDASPLFTRIADGFRLELHYAAPDQIEEDAVRAFVAWLRALEVATSDVDALTLDEFADALRAAFALTSPPGGPASPPAALVIPAARAAEYADLAFRIWVTEIRALWRPSGFGASSTAASAAADAVLLAEVDVPVVPQVDDRWVVDETAAIEIRQERRPILLHLRLLQEWVAGREGAGLGRVAAAGILRGDVSGAAHRRPLVNGLRVTNVADGEMTIAFDGYVAPSAQGPFQFIVKAFAHARPSPGAPAIVSLGGFGASGITLRIADGQGNAITAAELASLDVSVEVTRIGA